jgi:phosphate starvation-inducible PhoH-like protein
VGKQLARKRSRGSRVQHRDAEIIEFKGTKFQHDRAPPPIKPLNPTQAEYLAALKHAQQVVVLGPAGAGKTFIAATYAADLFRQGGIERIVLTRPNVPCGRSLGFFPGTMQEKFAPWAVPIAEAIKERIGEAAFDIAVKRGDIEMVPFEVMRGRTWKNAFVLLDEAQNTSVTEIKTFLTRIGEDCISVVNGDVGQSDIRETSGLRRMIDLIREHALPVPVIEFGVGDIVRSGLCAMWVRAFEGDARP